MIPELPTLSKNRSYTRKEISALLGGNETSYLPFKNGCVLYAAITKELNPEAPNKILVGTGRDIMKAGAMLCAQKEPLPVFLKSSSAVWKFDGYFVLWRWSNKPEDIERESRGAERADVSRVIELRRVEEMPDSLEALAYSQDDFSAFEGGVAFGFHRMRERAPELVRRKKRSVLKASGRLICEVCAFDFATFYGPIGDGFAECHHTKPISEYEGTTRTTLEDLAIVCANCHRMLHQSSRLSVRELKEVVESRRQLPLHQCSIRVSSVAKLN